MDSQLLTSLRCLGQTEDESSPSMKEGSSATGKTNTVNVQRDKRKQCSPTPKKKCLEAEAGEEMIISTVSCLTDYPLRS